MYYTSSWNPTASQYAHQWVVEAFGDHIQNDTKWGFTHITQILLYTAVIHGMGY